MRLSWLCVLALAACGGPASERSSEVPSPTQGSAPAAAPATGDEPAGEAAEEAPEPVAEAATGGTAAEEENAARAQPTLAPVAGSLRIVIVHEGELLASEERQVERFVARVGRGRSAERATSDPTESAAAVGWLEGTGSPVPEAWATNEMVLALRFGPIEEQRSGRRSGGIVGVVVLRPGADAPHYSERVAQSTPRGCGTCQRPRFEGGDWADFVDGLLDHLTGAS